VISITTTFGAVGANSRRSCSLIGGALRVDDAMMGRIKGGHEPAGREWRVRDRFLLLANNALALLHEATATVLAMRLAAGS